MKHVIQLTPCVRPLKGIYLAVLIFCSSIAYSQSALNIMDLYHETFTDSKALTLLTYAYVGNYSYHTNVGGISFQAVASPGATINKQDVSLDFADNRLVVKIGARTFYPDLPFWQLYPIVNFVSTSYNVAFTQLGNMINKGGAQDRFHPAFLDNLLGLRLFQADLLNFTDILWDIPIDAQRRYIFAPSERRYTPVMNEDLRKRIYDKLVSGGFTSFVLTDKSVNVVFDIDDSGLKFSGRPYYYFTKTVLDTVTINSIKAQLIDCYKDIDTNAKLLLKNEYTPDLNPRTNLNGLVKVLVKNKQGKVFNPYAMYYVEEAISKIDSLNKMTDAQVGIQFNALDDFTESFKPYWDLLKQYNPLVYSAVENTAQWSAFFRYVSKANPTNWTLFVKKVQNEGTWDAPAVKTPTSADINYFRYFDERDKSKR